MKFSKAILGIAALLLSTSVFATPHYNLKTDGSGLNLYADLEANGAGVYIWSDGLDDWNIAWSAQTAGAIFDFFGTVRVSGNGMQSAQKVDFEVGDGLVNGVISGVGDDARYFDFIEVIAWESGNNTQWDGIHFTLNDALSSGELLTFELFTTMLTLSPLGAADVPGTDIFISDLFNTPNVELIAAHPLYDSNYPNIVGQRFEIKIPEPSIIALFGLGLVGMGFAARRRKA